MKLSRLLIRVAFVLFLPAIPVFAQDWTVRVTIPFDFAVAKEALPAGEYRVSINGPAMLRVARINGQDVAGVMTESVRGAENVSPRLIFHRFGKQYFLAEVCVGELNLGHQLFATAAELEIARISKSDRATILATQVAAK